YRDLLNRWKLWHQRAKFDIIRHAVDKSRVPGQAFVSCNYCGKSIACNMTLASRPRASHYNPPPNNRPKSTICPGCRKPLPRCALCLTNLGTLAGSNLYMQKDKTDWFREHAECPVTGCLCHCMTLDPNSQL
ncbi:MIO-like protein, partial [Mya arenaria]